MNSIYFTEEHILLKKMVREFAQNELAPLAQEIDKEENKGKYQLRGCCVSGDNPEFYCNDCGEEF